MPMTTCESLQNIHMHEAQSEQEDETPMSLKECISTKIAAPTAVLIEIPLDKSPAYSLLLVLTTPAKGKHHRRALPKVMSAQRHGAQLATRPSLVLVTRRAQHRLARQIEMHDTGVPAEPTRDEAIKLYLERFKGMPPPHGTAALEALASVRNGSSMRAHVMLTREEVGEEE